LDSLLRADTLKLEEHEDLVRRELRTARLLKEQLSLAQRHARPEDTWIYDQLIDKAMKLEQYFSGMANQVDQMSVELVRLSVEIGELLRDAGRQLHTPEK